jgi:hypothetical protein
MPLGNPLADRGHRGKERHAELAARPSRCAPELGSHSAVD